MKKHLFIFALLAFGALPLRAQYAWCGYALIEGLPLLENQLAVIAALTSPRTDRSRPEDLFQYRYNLAHTAVIVEGCWQAEPRRELIVSLLEQTVKVEPRQETPVIDERIDPAATQPVEISVRDYIEQNLIYSIFAPGGTREDSAASVRAYLAANIKAWELEDVQAEEPR